MEVVRPQVDAYLLDWITRQPLNRERFFEQRDGNCRLMAPFVVQLTKTAPIWGRAVAPIAEWVAHAFWSTIRKPDAPFVTRLTQGNKREAKGHPSVLPLKPVPQPESICRVCGAAVPLGRIYCFECDATSARERIVEIAKVGRVASQAPGPKARRGKVGLAAVQHASLVQRANLHEQNSAPTSGSRKPRYHVGAGRFCHLCRCDPRGPTATPSETLGGAGGTGWSFGRESLSNRDSSTAIPQKEKSAALEKRFDSALIPCSIPGCSGGDSQRRAAAALRAIRL